MGNGFPLLGEGQIGVFFLPNLILYLLFSPVTAYNLSLVCIFLFFGWGMYGLFIHFRISPLIAIFGALSLTFSGFMIPQIPHITLLQALSLFPLMILLGIRFLENLSVRKGLLLAIIGSQQFFAGFPQVTVLTWGFIGIYIFYHARSFKRAMMSFSMIGVVVFAMIALSAIQLFPSLEFLKYTDASGGFDQQTATFFSYPYKQFLTLLHPYLLGSPKDGSFPPFYKLDGTIFWETSGFVGILPLIGLIIYGFSANKNKRLNNALWILLFGSALLMLGKYSPLYFVFSFPPLNLFRVPARFLWYFSPTLVIMSCLGFEFIRSKLSHQKQWFMGITLIGIQLIHLFGVWYSYHLIQPAQQWLEPPEVVSLLSPQPTVFALGDAELYNKFFVDKGWGNNPNIYPFLRNTFTPNGSIYWNIPNVNVYAGRQLARQGISEALLQEHVSHRENTATVSATGKQLFQLFGITDIVTPYAIANEVPTATLSGEIALQVYKQNQPLPRVYIADKVIEVHTLQDVVKEMDKPTYAPQNVTLIENDLKIEQPTQPVTTTITQSSNQALVIEANNNNIHDVLMVVQDSYYPGWKVAINQQTSKIYAVNIRNRGVIIPSGKSIIHFTYQPDSYLRGRVVSSLAHAIAIVLIFFPIFRRHHRRF